MQIKYSDFKDNNIFVQHTKYAPHHCYFIIHKDYEENDIFARFSFITIFPHPLATVPYMCCEANVLWLLYYVFFTSM